MKKLIMAAVASISLGASAYNEVIFDTNRVWRSAVPQKIQSVFVLNNSAIDGGTENISIWATYKSAYTKLYKWLSSDGDEVCMVPQKIGVKCAIKDYANIWMPCVIEKVSGDDPNAYHGEVSGYFYVGPSIEEGYVSTNLIGKFVIDTYTDPGAWKVKARIHCENNFKEQYRYPVDPVIDEVTNECDIPNFLKDLGHISMLNRNCNFYIPEGAYTNEMRVTKLPYTFYNTFRKEFVKISGITDGFMITNDVNAVIPSQTSLNITTTSPQTRIGILFE